MYSVSMNKPVANFNRQVSFGVMHGANPRSTESMFKLTDKQLGEHILMLASNECSTQMSNTHITKKKKTLLQDANKLTNLVYNNETLTTKIGALIKASIEQ